ncbi:hypothetical protein [Gallaecimonas pentaromativorans]|uniref:Uncharacterized protein n=1 Tax=Gallaecimonas pentaromativorans TaxID=584787 RepID=A0A3N1NQ65_9GAMM|nr:hypothetical protein [Gallaecimonas pentaromativorans]ROQ18303.1 hypothetical protein EDC28_11814 [Gallaecimonas pentaromativorans]
MSLTLGVGIKSADISNIEDLKYHLTNTVAEFGYGVTFGVSTAVEHVRPGLQGLVDAWSLALVAVIHAPNNELAEASEISINLIEGGDREKALSFFSSVCLSLSKKIKSFSVFFAVEDWTEDMRIRIQSGSIDEFMRCVSRPSGWWEEYYSPKSNVINCDDSHPFVFSVN